MGLDVYLCRYDIPPAEVEKREQETSESKLDEKLRLRACEETGIAAGEYGYPQDGATEEQRAKYNARVGELFAEHGLDQYGSPGGYGVREKIEEDSRLHPKHMFKIGYFRSRYNEGGLNSVLGALIGKSLGDIFPGEDYTREVNWSEALTRAKSVRDEYRAARERYGNVTLMTVGFNMFRDPSQYPKGADEAFAFYKSEADKRASSEPRPDWDCYGNVSGEFMWAGFVVKAAIPMISVLNSPAVLLVGEWPKKPDAPDEPEWYGAALDVVVETCEWVLAQPNPQRFFLHWSG